ncbi:hypothetical protein [Nonomuraea sp. NPDC049695]|uniref:hypothetical protein n=1 Tax=Nonomuraea sp. NPDC049695 TaxID=3154734 RepID=UPI0034404FC5
MREIEFRLGSGRDEILIDGVPLLDLVRAAELPYARQEQLERAEEFAPEPAPLLAGAYSYLLGRWTGWPARHYLGEPVEVTYDQEDDETMLLGCACGISECWALLARIEVTETEVRWSGFRNNSRDWDLSAVLGPFVFARRQYEEALRATAPPLAAPPPAPVIHDDVRLVPVIDVLSGLVYDLTEDYPAPPADESLWDAYWSERIAAAGLPKPMPGNARLIPLSGFLDEEHLTLLVRSTLQRSPGDDAGADDFEDVGCVAGGYLLMAAGRPLVAPGCCSDLTDLASWREAARHREGSPSMVWIGHPWLNVTADGDKLLLTGPTEHDPGPELAWITRRALDSAVRQAAAEVRYFARPLHELCARLAGTRGADALCTALLGGAWLRAGSDWPA